MKSGDLVEGYSVRILIGEGGFGQVWNVEKGNEEFALKVCNSIEEEDRSRFNREYRLISSLQSSNVIKVYHIGEVEGKPFFIMEKCDTSLKDLVEQGISFSDKVDFSLQICSGLKFLHDHNVYHRDIKPENILIKGKVAKLIDFGIGRFINRDTATITTTNEVLGSYSYCAPEVIDGGFKHYSKESDIYSLGGVLYFIFADASMPYSINPKYIPADIFPIIDRCRKPNYEDRYHDVSEVYQAIQLVISARSSLKTMAEVHAARYSLPQDELVSKTISLVATSTTISELLDKFIYINDMWKLLNSASPNIADSLIPIFLSSFERDSSPWLQFHEIDYLASMVSILYNGTTDIVYQQELSKIGIKFSVGYNRWDAMKTIYDNIILNINETNAILYKDVIKECSEDLLRIEECFGSRAILPMAVKQIITSAQ